MNIKVRPLYDPFYSEDFVLSGIRITRDSLNRTRHLFIEERDIIHLIISIKQAYRELQTLKGDVSCNAQIANQIKQTASTAGQESTIRKLDEGGNALSVAPVGPQ